MTQKETEVMDLVSELNDEISDAAGGNQEYPLIFISNGNMS